MSWLSQPTPLRGPGWLGCLRLLFSGALDGVTASAYTSQGPWMAWLPLPTPLRGPGWLDCLSLLLSRALDGLTAFAYSSKGPWMAWLPPPPPLRGPVLLDKDNCLNRAGLHLILIGVKTRHGIQTSGPNKRKILSLNLLLLLTIFKPNFALVDFCSYVLVVGWHLSHVCVCCLLFFVSLSMFGIFRAFRKSFIVNPHPLFSVNNLFLHGVHFSRVFFHFL